MSESREQAISRAKARYTLACIAALAGEVTDRLATVRKQYDAACRKYRAGEPGMNSVCQQLFNELASTQTAFHRTQLEAHHDRT